MEKCKLSEEEVEELVIESDIDPNKALLFNDFGFLTADAHKLVQLCLRLQRERIVARVRHEAELFDGECGGAALGNLADILERDS